MNVDQIKKDIFNVRQPEKQYQAAYQMRYVQNDSEIVHILFRACYEAKDPRLQQEAVKSLGILKPKRALEAFIKSTHNSDTDKRCRAYYHLGTLGNLQGLDTVLKGLSDPNEKVRRAAAIAAGRIGNDQRALNALLKLLNDFEPAGVSAGAKTSIRIIKQKMTAGRKFDNENSLNAYRNHKRYHQKSFNKTQGAPKTYIPKAF